MNKRLKQLAAQAGMTDDKFGMFFAKDGHNEDGVDLEKFAELIVQECVNICDDIADPTLCREAEYHSRMAPGASYASKVIKLRFSELNNDNRHTF